MAVREILTFPDRLLHRISKPVKTFDAGLAQLAADMVETMRAADGIGLAAPQIGENLRLLVVQIPNEDGTDGVLYQVCNPVIARREGQARIEEGCLSLPGFYVEVDRAADITVEGCSPDGHPFSLRADGLLAICLQHEMDHLEGRLLVNYVGPVARELYKDELKRRAKDSDRLEEDRRPVI
jgi:peptide deformylase